MSNVGKILTLILACLSLLACSSLTPHGSRTSGVEEHTVRKGDTLYGIAFRYGYDYREIAAWNRISAPYRIFPGQKLIVVPPNNARRAASASSSGGNKVPIESRSLNTTRQTTITTTKPRSPSSSSTIEKRATAPNLKNRIDWRWPTLGKIVTTFAPAKGEKGLDISGKLGQPVWASEEGEVVYSGKGLIGYGNLIIIKHDDLYLSAYGHNQRLLVKEGDKVRRGQQIAEMGKTNKDGAILHFEIRKNGSPVDPMRYLPR